jgi:hypothetical protein
MGNFLEKCLYLYMHSNWAFRDKFFQIYFLPPICSTIYLGFTNC